MFAARVRHSNQLDLIERPTLTDMAGRLGFRGYEQSYPAWSEKHHQCGKIRKGTRRGKIPGGYCAGLLRALIPCSASATKPILKTGGTQNGEYNDDIKTPILRGYLRSCIVILHDASLCRRKD